MYETIILIFLMIKMFESTGPNYWEKAIYDSGPLIPDGKITEMIKNHLDQTFTAPDSIKNLTIFSAIPAHALPYEYKTVWLICFSYSPRIASGNYASPKMVSAFYSNGRMHQIYGFNHHGCEFRGDVIYPRS